MARFFQVDGLNGLFPWFGRMSLDLWRPLRQWVYKRDGGKCCYCGSFVELHKCHCHHVLELSQGGTNHPSNLKTLCVSCHHKRHPHMVSLVERLRLEEARRGVLMPGMARRGEER